MRYNKNENENKNAAKKSKTYNTRDSLVVTDPTTNPALSGLTRGERTGSRIFQMVWSYVKDQGHFRAYIARTLHALVRLWSSSYAQSVVFPNVYQVS